MSTTATSVNALATAPSGGGGFSWTNLIILLVITALAFIGFKWIRPRLHEQRRAAWEKAGLLPEQLDPEKFARDEQERLAKDQSESSKPSGFPWSSKDDR